jgi:hypothetical protein
VLWVTSRWNLGLLRATGTLGSANGFGGLIACGTAWMIFWPNRMKRRTRWMLVLAGSVGVFASQSKSAVMSLALSVALVGTLRLLWARQTKATRLLRGTALGTALLIALATLVSFYGPIQSALQDDLEGRTVFTAAALNAYKNFEAVNILFGVGLSNGGYVDAQNGVWMTAHNCYVTLLSELGLVGTLLIAGLLLAALLWSIRRQMWQISALLVVMALHSMTEQFLLAPPFVILLGWSVTLVFSEHKAGSRLARRYNFILPGAHSPERHAAAPSLVGMPRVHLFLPR